MNDEILVAANDLSRRYGPHLAVDGISLALQRGEVLGLLGPNGAGKTTTLRMLVGSLAPSRGQVKIGGIDLADDPRAAKRLLGYLPETPPLHRELSVDEFLEFCARIHGIARKDCRAAVAAAKTACGLDEVSRQVIGSLSKGFQQRVGLAQAIVHKPPLIILDEPTVGLDPNQIREIRSLIARLAENHGIILSSHILPEIQAVCSRVMIVAAGREVFSAKLAELQQPDPTLRIELARPPALSELALLAGVASVSALEPGCFQLTPEAGCDPRDALVQQAVQADWGLRELRSERRSLEDVFVALTNSDTAAREAA